HAQVQAVGVRSAALGEPEPLEGELAPAFDVPGLDLEITQPSDLRHFLDPFAMAARSAPAWGRCASTCQTRWRGHRSLPAQCESPRGRAGQIIDRIGPCGGSMSRSVNADTW